MTKPHLFVLMLGVCWGSYGQKPGYQPFKSLEPGRTSQASVDLPPPSGPDQTAALSFVSSDLGAPIPLGGIIEWLDVDSDRDLDFLIVDGTIRLFENINQNFVEVSGTGLDMVVTAHYITDLNQDNRIDIMFIENRSIKIAYNNGDKTFSVVDIGVPLTWDGAPPLYCFDVDGDSDLDIITRPEPSFYAFIPSQRFGNTNSIAYPPEFKFMSFANLDNSGVLDFFLAHSDTKGYTVLSTGMNSGLVWQLSGTNNLNVPQNKVLWADMDLDGDLDLIALTTVGWRAYESLFSQTGTLQFNLSMTVSTSTSITAALGDLNSDGKPDLVVTSSPGPKIDIYRNISSPNNLQFTFDSSIPVSSSQRLYLIDIDGQGGLDIVSHSKVYKNTLAVLSPPPTTPMNLVCRYGSGTLQLSWQSAGPGLHYRYEVYLDDELFISSESADDGFLLVNHKTPIVLGSTVILNSLPAGKYAFRVQSIDASFRSSAFSELKEVDVPVGLEDTFKFAVHPNPAADRVTVNLPSAGQVTVRDNHSRTVFQQTWDPSLPPMAIAVGGWAAGVYSVHFEVANNRLVRKLVIAR